MALASIVSGADCGPVNPLHALTKTWEKDRGLQQDRLNPASGPSQSRHAFRSLSHGAPSQDEANTFFSSAPARSHASPYDLEPLQHSLPKLPDWAADFASADPAFAQPSSFPQAQPAWIQDFSASQEPAITETRSHTRLKPTPANFHHSHAVRLPAHYPPEPIGFNRQDVEKAMTYELHASSQNQKARWDEAFKASEATLTSEAPAQAKDWTHSTTPTVIRGRPRSPRQRESMVDDELARTAGELISAVGDEQNPKFLNSSFMDLMRKLRDKEVAVEGNKVVEQLRPVEVPATDNQVSSTPPDLLQKGKVRATGWGTTGPIFHVGSERARAADNVGASNSHVAPTEGEGKQSFDSVMTRNIREGLEDVKDLWAEEDRRRESNRIYFQGDGGQIDEDDMAVEPGFFVSNVAGATSSWEEDFDAAGMVGGPQAPVRPASPYRPSRQQQEWDTLQRDWEAFEASATGIRPVRDQQMTDSGYIFHSRNPYLAGNLAEDGSQRQYVNIDHSSTTQHWLHSQTATVAPTFQSVLQQEAAVQSNPGNPAAWLALGVKQQENEREDMAILALNRAVEIDPKLEGAWLALAVSYTNENDRAKAYDAIERWASIKTEYTDHIATYRATSGFQRTASALSGRHAYLTGLLIEMARARKLEDVDADVQIALGVLFITSEEYEKAGDCFSAALSVRPNDPLLYNRLGATLANSGNMDDAIRYYYRALELQPAYVRARYNLAIACVNLSDYTQAAMHLLRALALQKNEFSHMNQIMGDADPGKTLQNETALSGVTSAILWDSLRMCCSLLHRSELASACEARNLQAFKGEFSF